MSRHGRDGGGEHEPSWNDLIARTLAGDRKAEEELFGHILRVATAKFCEFVSPEDADDLAQKFSLFAWRDDYKWLRSFDPQRKTPFHYFLTTMVRWLALRHLRRRDVRESRRMIDLTLIVDILPSRDSPGAVIELLSSWLPLVRQLSPDDQLLFLLLWFEFSIEEIADLLNIKRNAVDQRIRRLRDRLRDLLDGPEQ